MPGAGLSTDLTPVLEDTGRQGGVFLLESQALDLVDTLGISTPRRLFVESSEDVRTLDLDLLPGERVVVKVVAEGLAHKTELGGVSVVAKRPKDLREGIQAMAGRFVGHSVAGFLVAEFIEHREGIGGELLLSVRWTNDFGPIVTLGPGGIQAEFLSKQLDEGRAAAILSPVLDTWGGLDSAMAAKSFLSLATEPQRGREPLINRQHLTALTRSLFDFAQRSMPDLVAELEINPLVFRNGEPVALDALVRRAKEPVRAAAPRPLDKIHRLLRPRSLAIMGVSTKMNPGRIILDNVLEAGFEKESIFILKPGHEILAGCRCVPDFASLPEPVDLAVLCIGAGELPATVEEIISEGRAETLILIAGGLGERPGTESHSQALGQLIEDSRATDWRGPLVNGGNCLGVRSVPGRYDTLFIPRHKLSYPEQPPAPLALISQSGALAVAKASCFAELNPRYLISLGNQIDLTVGDYLTYLKDDDEVRVFACYVEGFQPLDGRRWVEAAAEITRSGRAVVLYRAGRTEAGGRAAATHTASIAGDYAVTRELASAAGVLVADTLADFEDLVRLACALDPREVEGNRLAALSNAGFESVAIADSVQHLELAELARTTVAALDGLLASHRLSTIVGATNPLDVTPILGDAPFTESFSLLLEDEAVDLGLVGCVPLTGALQTLESGEGHREDIHEAGSVVQRLARLWRQTSKPWVAAVDGGPRFDAMARLLAAEGVPVFRTIDRAARLLETYVQWRLRPRR